VHDRLNRRFIFPAFLAANRHHFFNYLYHSRMTVDRFLYNFILVRCISVSSLFGCVDDVSSAECDVDSLVVVVDNNVVNVAVVKVVGIGSAVNSTTKCQ